MNFAIEIINLYKEYNLGSYSYKTFKKDIKDYFNELGIFNKKNNLLENIPTDNSERKFLALNNINLKIPLGQKVGLIGKNGSGKSTMLKILSSVTSPSSGEIKVSGKLSSLLEVGVGFHHELTGRENIYLSASILGVKKKIVDEKIKSILDFSDIGKHIDTPIKRYSSGMLARLGFAVSISFDSDILIIDEILAVGDIHFREKAIKELMELSKNKKKTIIFVSHNMSLMRSFCDKIILMDKGSANLYDNADYAIKKYESLK